MKTKIYREVNPNEELPKPEMLHIARTKTGLTTMISLNADGEKWIKENVLWFLEEIELPSDEDIIEFAKKYYDKEKFMSSHIADAKSYIDGAKDLRNGKIKTSK